MKKMELFAAAGIIFLIIFFTLYQYVFSIYEITYSLKPEALFADNTSTVLVKVVPLNSFGKEAPFRSAQAVYEIQEGKELIDVVAENKSEGYIILRAKGDAGIVTLIARSTKSLLPSIIEINILPLQT